MDGVINEHFIKRSLNCEKSRKALEYILKQFKSASDLEIGRDIEAWDYNDNYAGAYFDEEGYLVFCTVNIDTLDVGRYAGQVSHKKYKYSYKHLHDIQTMIADSFMKASQGVCSAGIAEKENLVIVEVRDNEDSDSLIKMLIEFFQSKNIEHDAVRIQKFKGTTSWFNKKTPYYKGKK